MICATKKKELEELIEKYSLARARKNAEAVRFDLGHENYFAHQSHSFYEAKKELDDFLKDL